MSVFDKPTLSTTFYDPEGEPVPEPDPIPEPEAPKKRRGRPPGTKNTPKKKPIPWFKIWWVTFWAAACAFSIIAMYFGVQSWLGQSAAWLSVAVVVPPTAYLLSRDWKKLRASK